MKTSVKRNKERNASVTRRSIAYLREALDGHPAWKGLAGELCRNGGRSPVTAISGVQGSLVSLIASRLAAEENAPVLVVAGPDYFDIYDNDLSELIESAPVHTVADELAPALGALGEGKKPVLLATVDDLLLPLKNPAGSSQAILKLETGRETDYGLMTGFLAANAYRNRDFVEEEGDFSMRGSIVDIFPFGSKTPVRAEFFGDSVTSLRAFDTNSQLSGETLSNIVITGSFAAEDEHGEDGSWTLADYLPAETVVMVDDIASFLAHEQAGLLSARLEKFRRIDVNRFEKEHHDFQAGAQSRLNANFRLLARELCSEESQNLRTVFAGRSKKEIEELAEFVSEEIADTGTPEEIEVNWIALDLHSGFVFNGCDVYTESDIFGKLHRHKSHRKRSFKGISLKDLQKLKVGDYIVHEDYGIGIFRAMETIEVGDSEQECVLVEYQGGDQLYVNVQNIRLLSKYTAAEGSLPVLSKLGSPKWKTRKNKVKQRLKDIASNLIKLYAKRKTTPGFAFGEDSIFQREFEASFIFDETPDQLKAIEDVKKDMQSPAPMDRLICGDAGFGKTEIAMRAAFKAVEAGKQVAVLTPTTVLAHQHAETFARRFENFPVTIAVLSRFVSRKDQKATLERISKGLVDIVIGTHRLVSRDVVFQDLGLLVIDEEQHFGVATKEKLRQAFPGVDTLTMSATPIPRTLQFSMLGARDLSIVSTPPKNRQPVETVITGFDAQGIEAAVRREINREGQVFFLHNRISGLDQAQNTVRELVPDARIATAHGQMPSGELENVMMAFINHDIDVLISTSIIGSGLDISNANTIIINRADMFGLSDLYQLRGRVGRSERKAYCYLITPPVHTLKREAMQRLAVIESFTELGSGLNIAMRDLEIRGAGNLLGAEQSGAIHELGFDLYQKLLEEAVAELKTGAFKDVFGEEESAGLLPAANCDMSFHFDALIPDHYISSTQERFAFYEKISKATSDEKLAAIESELRDRFGNPPQDVRNLLGLAGLKNLCSAIGLVKLDIGHRTLSIHLPGEDQAEFYNGSFFRNLVTSIQTDWMRPSQPRFQQEKKMKLHLTHPPDYGNDPVVLMEHYAALLKKLSEAPSP